jgi:hypothetical protein
MVSLGPHCQTPAAAQELAYDCLEVIMIGHQVIERKGQVNKVLNTGFLIIISLFYGLFNLVGFP